MALSVPLVDDPKVNQALNAIATQFPLKTNLLVNKVITTEKLVEGSVTAEIVAAEAIQAGHIEAGTITATQIKAAAITGAKIVAGTIEGKHLQAGTIEATSIKAGSITADKLAVTELSAISANMGSLTSGTITGGLIRSGTGFPRVEWDSLGIRALVDAEDRTNLCTNPTAGAGATTGWTNSGLTSFSAVTLGSGGAPAPNLGLLALGVFSGFHATGNSIADRARIEAPVVSGKTYRFSAWVYVEAESTSQVKFSAGPTGSEFKFVGAALVEEEWQRADLEFTADSTGTWRFAVAQAEAGTSDFYFTAVLIEQEDEPAETPPFFFPTPHQLETKTVEWTGTPHASTSIRTADETFYFDTQTGILLAHAVLSSADGSEIDTTHLSGELTSDQIKELEAAKLTGQITTTQITDGAISTPKLEAGGVTTEKIAANTIVAGDIAGETITGEQIKGGTITGAKMSVSELSAITANLGTITAGTITGATFRTSASNPKVQMDSAGLRALGSEGELLASLDGEDGLVLEATDETTPFFRHRLSWNFEEEPVSSMYSFVYAAPGGGQQIGTLLSPKTDLSTKDINSVSLHAHNEKADVSVGCALGVRHEDEPFEGEEGRPGTGASVTVAPGTAGDTKWLLKRSGLSDFLQLTSTAKRKVNFGEVKIKVESGTDSGNVTTVEHGLGATPKYVGLIPQSGKSGTVIAPRLAAAPTSSKFEATFASDATFGSTQEITHYWLAIG